MAVQIPRVQALEVQPGASSGRVQTEAPDPSRAFAATSQATEGLLRVLDKVENDSYEVTNNKLAHDFEQWYKLKIHGDPTQNIQGITHLEGDPTEAYSALDQEALKKIDEISSSVSGFTDTGKKKARAALSNKYNTLYNQRLVNASAQYDKFDASTVDASVSSEKMNASEVAGLIRPGDDSTLAPFEQTLNRIRTLRLKRGMRIGTVQEAEDGNVLFMDDDGEIRKVKVTTSVALQIKKDLADATSDTISNFVKEDQLGHADYLLERYKDQIDPVGRAKIQEAYNKAETKAKALESLGKMEDLAYPEQKKKIKAMPANTPRQVEIKQEALKLLDANERYKTQLQTRDSTEVYNNLSGMVLKRMQSDMPFTSVVELEANPMFKGLIGRVTTAAQKKALYEMVEAPKESDQGVYTDLMDAMGAGQFYGMSSEQLHEQMVGLSKRDKNWFNSQWARIKLDTEGQERSRLTYVTNEVMRQYRENGLARYDSRGKQTKRSQQEMNKVVTRILKESDTIPRGASPGAIAEFTQEAISKEAINQKRLKEGWIGKFRRRFTGEPDPVIDESLPLFPGSQRKQAPAPLPSVPKDTTDVRVLSPKEQVEAWREFEAANKRPPKNAAEMMEWRKNKGEN